MIHIQCHYYHYYSIIFQLLFTIIRFLVCKVCQRFFPVGNIVDTWSNFSRFYSLHIIMTRVICSDVRKCSIFCVKKFFNIPIINTQWWSRHDEGATIKFSLSLFHTHIHTITVNIDVMDQSQYGNIYRGFVILL